MAPKIDRRETVFQTLRFEQPSRCPYYIWIDEGMVAPLVGHFGAEQLVVAPRSAYTFAGSYTALTEIKAAPVKEEGDCFVDDYGVGYRRGSTLHVEKPALNEPSLEGYTFPDLTTDAHFAHLDEWIAVHAERFRIVQLGMLFFERAWGMRNMDEFFVDLHLHPQFVGQLLDGLEGVCHAVIDRLLRDYGERIDAIGVGEDYGGQNRLLISPECWREFIRPRLERLVRHIRQGGKVAYLHSCGHVTPIIPDLIEIGVNMLQPIQPESMDLFDLKRRFGRNICLVGGISTQQLLPYGSPDEIRAHVARCRGDVGAGGGYVLAPAKPILPDVPLENAVALIEAFQEG